MKMHQCPRGHFYDTEKHVQCPYCIPGQTIGYVRTLELPQSPVFPKTVPLEQAESPVFPKTMPLEPVVMPRTMALQNAAGSTEPVRGWLVCTDGDNKGRDFRIQSDENLIGRDAGNAVSLDFDNTVSEFSHAILTYDKAANKFWFRAAQGQNSTYVNDLPVLEPVEMHSHDLIRIGRTCLIFIPLCSERFVW